MVPSFKAPSENPACLDVQKLTAAGTPNPETHKPQSYTQKVLGTGMGDSSPNQKSNSCYRIPTFYHIGTMDPLGHNLQSLRPKQNKQSRRVLANRVPKLSNLHEQTNYQKTQDLNFAVTSSILNQQPYEPSRRDPPNGF